MAGTPSTFVTPSSSTIRSESPGSNRSSRTRAAPDASDNPRATFSPKTWKRGTAARLTSSARTISPGSASICPRLAPRFPCVSMAAFAAPDVPEVKSRTARSFSSRVHHRQGGIRPLRRSRRSTGGAPTAPPTTVPPLPTTPPCRYGGRTAVPAGHDERR